MKRCYLVIKDVKNFPQEGGFVVYAESILDLINILQDKLMGSKTNKKGKEFFDISEGMVIDLGEAFEVSEDMGIEKFDILYRGDISYLKEFCGKEDDDSFSWD